MAAKLLLAIHRPEQLRDWEAVAHAVLAQPIPEVAWDADSDGLFTAFSPDGTRGATGYPDGTLRVWRADGQGEPVVLQAYGAVPASSAAFSPDGSRVVTAHEDGAARLWFLSVDGLRQQLRNANPNCMPPSMRQTYLGEQEEESRKGHEACERSYGRAPRLPLPR